MIRKAFKMYVNPETHAEYERRHNPIWTELEEVLKSHGAHHYAIFLDAEFEHPVCNRRDRRPGTLGRRSPDTGLPALVGLHERGDARQPG